MSEAAVSCTKCNKNLKIDTRYFQKFGQDPFCRDCLIHTECNDCKSGLRLEPSRYQELGGDPIICTDCDQRQSSSSSGQNSGNESFWSGLSIGEKFVFPILLLGFLGMAGLAIFADMNGGEFSTPVLGGVGFLLYWLYRRGQKHK